MRINLQKKFPELNILVGLGLNSNYAITALATGLRNRLVYFNCENSTSYRITTGVPAHLRAAVFSDTPIYGDIAIAGTGVTAGPAASYIDITTPASNSKYIAMQFFFEDDNVTLPEALAGSNLSVHYDNNSNLEIVPYQVDTIPPQIRLLNVNTNYIYKCTDDNTTFIVEANGRSNIEFNLPNLGIWKIYYRLKTAPNYPTTPAYTVSVMEYKLYDISTVSTDNYTYVNNGEVPIITPGESENENGNGGTGTWTPTTPTSDS